MAPGDEAFGPSLFDNQKFLRASMRKTGPHWHRGEVRREFIIETKAISFHFNGLLGSTTAQPSE
jgi:hypothetical protein